MDLYTIGHFYVDKLVEDINNSTANVHSSLSASNINVLLLDNFTKSVISMVATQSDLLDKNIFLIDVLENKSRDNLNHLNCLIFLNLNNAQTLSSLIDEIVKPNYSNYKIYNTNLIPKSVLEKLAKSDKLSLISKIYEIFWDYLIINKNLFLSNQINNISNHNYNIFKSSSKLSLNDTFLNNNILKDISNSVLSILLSFKIKPVIKFESNSKVSSTLANHIFYQINSLNSNYYSLFNDNNLKQQSNNNITKKPLLLILDRRNDPISSLVLPWTYQSMIMELVGIHNNIVNLSSISSSKSNEINQFTLNVESDNFFKDSVYLNFADLSDKIRDYVNLYKQKSQQNDINKNFNNSKNSGNMNIDSITSIKKFLENFPEFKKLSSNVNKHISITSELDKKINNQRLWDISELEQILSVNENDYSLHKHDLSDLKHLLLNLDPSNNNGQLQQISNKKPISDDAKIRLVCLYALKYELYPQNQTKSLIKILKSQNIPSSKIDIIKNLLTYSSSRKRLNEFNASPFTTIKSNSTNLFKSLSLINKGDNDTENTSAFMQHIPRLQNVLLNAIDNKLSTKNYQTLDPYNSSNNISESISSFSSNNPTIKYTRIIVYMLGGVTYEEARIVNQLNEKNSNKGISIILGSDKILNTKKFLSDLEQMSESVPDDQITESNLQGAESRAANRRLQLGLNSNTNLDSIL
ncbi:Vps45p [Ascoidea rubescens DSM 1968]|uniref:Sec1-like protein n=1 Tax=Ascoidea rubescens DSM 1968 TaxID=1344418 RepID=A0A1D2VL96_9ASCO|nr:Sec1-like protein [Ascoidea rubescens DSM 1968]ODV62372.1 Sec1-like protein [Ascoidea rubescens DSM 1968]